MYASRLLIPSFHRLLYASCCTHQVEVGHEEVCMNVIVAPAQGAVLSGAAGAFDDWSWRGHLSLRMCVSLIITPQLPLSIP